MAKLNSIGLFQKYQKSGLPPIKETQIQNYRQSKVNTRQIQGQGQIKKQGERSQKLEYIFEYIKDKVTKQHSYDNIRILIQLPFIIMTQSHSRALELVARKDLSNDEKQQLITLMRKNGIDMPDCMFENAYTSYLHNSKSSQKYIQLEQIIYSGLQLKLEKGMLKKFVLHFKKKLGDNTYIRRLNRFVHYITNPQVDVTSIQELMRQDFSDNETLKKTLTSFKRQRKLDEYIDRLNKYLSIEPLDEEAWLELAEIYTQKGHYMKAAFCYEELMVINPANDVFALKLSELYLTVGNKSMSEKAIQYLTYLISKRPDNIRALWILYRAIMGQQQHQQLKQACSDAINKLYSKKNPALKIHIAL